MDREEILRRAREMPGHMLVDVSGGAPAPANNGLRSELKALLNKHSAEAGSNTPDHILADFLLGCLATYDEALQARAAWYGRMDAP